MTNVRRMARSEIPLRNLIAVDCLTVWGRGWGAVVDFITVFASFYLFILRDSTYFIGYRGGFVKSICKLSKNSITSKNEREKRGFESKTEGGGAVRL
jgi:hypothetical protein